MMKVRKPRIYSRTASKIKQASKMVSLNLPSIQPTVDIMERAIRKGRSGRSRKPK